MKAGLSFAEARVRLRDGLQQQLSHNQLRKWVPVQRHQLQRGILNLCTLVGLLVVFGVAVQDLDSYFVFAWPGLLFAAFVYLAALLFSLASFSLEQFTVFNEVHKISTLLLCILDRSVTSTGSNEPREDSFAQLSSGHSHLSIINVYRDSSWQRIPAVLLVEGDLIALMGGDVSPCRVQELKEELVVIPGKKSVNEFRWVSGNTLSAGEIIPLDVTAAEMGEAQGDQTPKSTNGPSKSSNSGATPLSSSTRNRVITSDSLEILKLSGNMRCFRVLESPSSSIFVRLLELPSSQSKESTFLQSVRLTGEGILLKYGLASCLLCGIIICLKRIFGDYFYKNVLYSICVPILTILVIISPPNIVWMESVIAALALSRILAEREFIMKCPESRMGIDVEVETENNDGVDSFRQRASSSPNATTTKLCRGSEAAYIWKLFVRNISVAFFCPTTYSSETIDLLWSLPFHRSNLCEELGSISTVCFIDDDVVCENNSVTEEILMMGENNENSDILATRLEDSARFDHNKKVSTPSRHSNCVVLDLHSGTGESGPRFENPLWWRYLPSLKPLGLACLMNQAASSSDLQDDSCNPLISPKKSFVQDSCLSVKQSLVQHVRKATPLGFLKNLAEEIGFQASDANNFNSVLEVNVLSPKLDHVYLSQDRHEMSLEESKRRGFLTPKLKSCICKDLRG